MRKPCEQHIGARLSKDGRCTKCESIRRMEYRARNLDKALAYRALYKERELALARARHADNPGPRRASVKKWQHTNPDKVRAQNVKTYHADPERHRARVKSWASANHGRVLAKARAWKEKNPEKAKKFRDESVRRWNQKNPGRRAAYVRQYQVSKLNATPSWANKFFITEAYRLAKLREKICGGKWHVDHIVPLKSKLVCGLHCESNLRVVPAIHNTAKGNRRWPNMPSEL